MWDVINKNMKKTICCMIILIVFSGLIMMGIQTKYVYYTTYCEDYYSIIANTESCNYEQIVAANGEPSRITREKNAVGSNYIIQPEYDDGRLFAFVDYGNDHPSLCRTELTNPEYRFGRKEIGVGTDKSTIEKVYCKSYRGLQQDAYGKYFVEDGNFEIYFYFDENDKVYKIIAGKAEIMHGIRGWKRK